MIIGESKMVGIKKTKIGILVLNYNGRRHLEVFMPKAEFLRYRNDATLVIIDNASGDSSAAFIAANYPWAIFIRNDSNYGWGEGYNCGIESLKMAGYQFSHYLFLNNDTEPSLEWFEKLRDAAAESASDVGEIGCRSVFKDKHIAENLLDVPTHACESIRVSPLVPLTLDKTGFNLNSQKSSLNLSVPLIRTSPGKLFAGNIKIDGIEAWYSIQLYNSGSQSITVQLSDGLVADVESVNDRLTRWVIRSAKDGVKSIEIGADQTALVLRVVNAGDFDRLPPIVQNSGIAITGTFEGVDMHLGDPVDVPQNHRNIMGICGVCKLVRADVFHELRGFDPAYFMYYEDLDFSLRLRKRGYKQLLVEDSILVHAHAGTSDARSMFFTRQVSWSLYYFHWRHAGLLRKLRSWVSWRAKAASERQIEPNPMARPSELAINKFAEVVGRPYLRPSAERQ